MEKELNIAAILKKKPNAILYDLLHNKKVKFDKVCVSGNETVIWCDNYLRNPKETICAFGYSEIGTVRGYLDGLQILKPSKLMRDWSKFAWKKGDMLRFSDILVMFEKWTKDDYTEFKASYEFNYSSNSFDNGNDYYTSDFCKATDDVADNYIKKVEEHYGGKLNLETLEIEQPKQEFKDGDIVYMGNAWNEYIGIIKNMPSDNQIETYAHCHKGSKEEAILGRWLNKNDSDALRLATDSEQKKLFDALAKKGKVWNSETKQIENLPKKCEFEQMDLCLMSDGFDESIWNLCQFAFKDGDCIYHSIGGGIWRECIPYNDSTKHLLGTTDEWKGGEG